MRRSDSLVRLGRTGSAGVLAVIFATSAAEAALPTGSMLLPRPKGPSRADLPIQTSIGVHRTPSAVAYGLVGGIEAPNGFADEEVYSEERAFLEEASESSDATSIADRPLIRPRHTATGDEANPFGVPAPAAAGPVADDPFATTASRDDSVPPDAWVTENAAEPLATEPVGIEPSEAAFAGLKGICPVTLREERRVVTPQPEFSSEFAGRRYEFATPEAKAAFDADPQKYAPVLGGRDVVLTAAGAEEAVGSLKHAGFYRERLYLFQSEETCKTFHADPRRYIVGE